MSAVWPAFLFRDSGRMISVPNHHFFEMLPAEQAKDQLLRQREGCPAGSSVQRLDPVNFIIFAMPDQRTTPGCHHIPVPVNLPPIGQLNHKAILDRTHNDRCLVGLAAAPPDMPDNAERSERRTRQSTGQGVQGVLEEEEKAITHFLLQIHKRAPANLSSQRTSP